MNLQRFPRHPLTFGPTPIQALPRLSAQLGGKVEIYAKREDCNSGLAFGGNKTRKLEYLIPEALAQGCDTLVTIGGIQSNHTRQVAAVAAHLGLRCVTVQENWVNWFDYFLLIRTRDSESFTRLHAEQLLYLPGVRQVRSFMGLREVVSRTEVVV